MKICYNYINGLTRNQNMRNKGFTLAETLITLVIIGVISAITIPVITANSKEAEYQARLKKGIATITGAVARNQALYWRDFYSTTSAAVKGDSEEEIEKSLYGIFRNNANINIAKTGPATYLDVPDYYAIYFDDGSILLYKLSESISSSRRTKIGDNKTVGIQIFFDVNGEKGPNILSNCKGKKSLTVKQSGSVPPVGDDCQKESKRVMKDIYKLRLQKDYVISNDTSTQWMLNN